ncbi:MAG TPA: SLC13 family permease [Stellaceae bacterium]|nr:SLC13 family permease [Stellaceae bacterium]
MHAAIVLVVLILTYAGMAAGRIAWLQVDRTGIALLAVITLLASGQMTLDDFGSDVDMPTIAFMFAMMIISAQFAEAGFIDFCARTIFSGDFSSRGVGTARPRGAAALLALTVALGGALSAVLATDILIVAIAPLLIVGAQDRGYDPRPLLIALAAATNAGSAATLIGNPLNILIGSVGRLDFWRFLAICAVPALFSLAVVFTVVWLQWRARITQSVFVPPPRDHGSRGDPKAALDPPAVPAHALDRNQTLKGIAALFILFILFATPLPREIGALIIAALLLANRKITSRTMIAAVDWPLLLLVSCLFALTGALNHSGIAAHILNFLTDHRLLPGSLVLLAPFSLLASNAIGGVPASMLLLQLWPSAPPGVLYGLALLSSLAGNLLLTGSLTNLLIAERAERMRVRLGFADYARAGVPIALISIGFAVCWLALLGVLPLLPG